MVSSGTKVLLICTLTLAVLQQTSCQLSILAIGIPQILSLLENVNETSSTTSSILPHLADALNIIANTQSQMANTQSQMANTQNQMSIQQTQMANTQSQMSIQQTQIVNSLNQTGNLLQIQSQQLGTMSASLTTMVDKLSEQNSNVTQIVATQTRMAESLDQIVDLLQIKNYHSENVSSLPGNTADPQVQQQWTTFSPTPTRVETTNAPITQRASSPIDCSDISAADNQGSGVYTIYPRDGLGSFQVYCNMDTDGGGWTVFQRRFNGSVDFFLDLEEYGKGFGNMWGEHWLGLQQVHRLTSCGQWTLRIEMEDVNGNTGYAQYKYFQIGDAASFYELSIGDYSGTAGNDALAYHNGQPFSTKDSDHDTCRSNLCQSYDGSCALKFQGAWWYNDCMHSNLNGLYQGSSSPVRNHPTLSLMNWIGFAGSGWTKINKSEMKIRHMQ